MAAVTINRLRSANRLSSTELKSEFRLKLIRIGYKNIPVSIDDAPKAVQAERNVETIISARSAQRIECVGGKVRWKISSH